MTDVQQTGAGKMVCVTGASGFIGSHIVKQLLGRGYTVRGTVRDASDEEKYGWLRNLEEGTTGRLELASADLLNAGSFDKAVAGCEFVCHVAAAVMLTAKDPKKDIVDPALEGTRNVFASILKARTARRVVITSSVAAIRDDFQPNGRTYTEEDWHHECSLKYAYGMGKTLAEKYAWKECEDLKQAGGQWSFELVSINPSLVLGEALDKSQAKSSLQVITQIVDGSMPLAPDFNFNVVHVRDVALAHVLALELAAARGRYILAEEGTTSMLDIARVIKTAYPQAKVPTLKMPTPVLYAFALLSPSLSLELVRRRAGMICYYSNKKARTELGIKFTPPPEAVLDAVKSLIHFGVVTMPGAREAKLLPGDTSKESKKDDAAA